MRIVYRLTCVAAIPVSPCRFDTRGRWTSALVPAARRLLHVGATRAVHQLWLTSVGTPSPLLPAGGVGPSAGDLDAALRGQ
jgi:hypothetical protein